MLKHMKAHKHLKPGENGTLRLVERFGDTLLCVRYRYDAIRDKPGNVPGTGFDVLCYEPFDYAYFLLALVVFISTNIQFARKQKRPIQQAAFYGVGIAIVWFISCFIAVGGMHLELGGKL